MGTNKKKRDRYKAQQEARKSGQADMHQHPLVVGWRARYDTVRSQLSETSSDHSKLQQEKQFLEKVVADMERTTQHEIRMRESMQESHKLLKESFAQLRKMHVATPDIPGVVIKPGLCAECHKVWPCPTITSLKEPTDMIITDLLKMERDLGDG